MNVYQGAATFQPSRQTVVTSGTFDGVHIGHQKILQRVTELAREQQMESVVLTFWPHPRMVLGTERQLKLLSTIEEKTVLLRQFGIDHLVILEFSDAFSQLSSHQFIQQVLVEQLRTGLLVIGHDHRFGKNREGGFEYLRDNAAAYGFAVEEIPKQMVEEAGVSSTLVRKALNSGEVHLAHAYLGRAYSVTGRVVQGNQLGRGLGFPTANIHLAESYKLIPQDGTYAVRVAVGDRAFNAMLNIGYRPSVGGGLAKTIEAHLFDFNGDLYGQELTVFFHYFLREERKFPDLEALRSQLAQDRIHAQQLLS